MPKRNKAERLEGLGEALLRIDPREREVYQLASVEDVPFDEIASRLGMSSAEVERLLACALLALDRELGATDRRWWPFR